MTNLPANADTAERPRTRAPRRPLRAQAADLRARYDALPRRQQWLVLAAIVLVAWMATDELIWSRARSWSAESSQIEAALEHHADVLEVAVFGVPSEEWGETVHAVVVVREGGAMTADDVVAFAKEHLAGYKVPRSVSFVDELPKTGSGKILKRELRAPFWAGRTSQV